MDKLENLFEKCMAGSSIFINHEILRHDYIPMEFPHREIEILKFGAILAPSLNEKKCSNLFIYGKPGTGKTAITRYVLDRISKKSIESNKRVKICYINCRVAGTEYRTISMMCSDVGVQVPFTGLATAEVLDRFKDGLDNLNSTFIVALDEIDMLVREYGDALLYKLTRINGELNSSQLIAVGISNDLYFKDMLDPRVHSSLSEEEIVFKPYTSEQIKDILLQRIKFAFIPNSLPDATLNFCAALAASEHGDARRALDLLRVAGEVAERNNVTVVSEGHVREAQCKIEHDRVAEVLNSLPLQSKIILYVLYIKEFESKHSVTTGDLYITYQKLCEKLAVNVLTQRRISGLLNELNMLGIIQTQIANLGRYGRTKKIQINVPQKTLKNVFLNDPRLCEFSSYLTVET